MSLNPTLSGQFEAESTSCAIICAKASAAVAIPPAGWAAWQCLRLKDPASDRPGQRIGANGAELRELVDGIAERSAPGRGGEYGVAVKRRVRGVDGAGEPILGDDREFLGLRLGQ